MFFRTKKTNADTSVRHERGVVQRIIVQRNPNPEITTYHLGYSLPVTESMLPMRFDIVDGCAHYNLNYWSSDRKVDVNPSIQELANKIAQIPGVVDELTMDAHEIRVSKAAAFSDIDIETQVILAIIETLGFDPEATDIRIRHTASSRSCDFESLPKWKR